MKLKPFFSYYGGKYRASRYFPKPSYSSIVEPFAGSAGYSLHYSDRKVTLYDINPVICGVWDYLIKSKERDIDRLPVAFDSVDELGVCQEAKWLIGFSLNQATSSPRKKPSSWMRLDPYETSYWNIQKRNLISNQLRYIRHWKVSNQSYESIPNEPSTWFIDPPYNNHAGSLYPYSDINYYHLSEWCLKRKGQLIVCENEGADWLPFVPFMKLHCNSGKNGKTFSKEAIYTSGGINGHTTVSR